MNSLSDFNWLKMLHHRGGFKDLQTLTIKQKTNSWSLEWRRRLQGGFASLSGKSNSFCHS